MDLTDRLRRALGAAAKTFADTLGHINPTAHSNGRDLNNYPERMFGYFYIQAITQALKTRSVLLELPVTGKGSQRMDNHVDALIFNDHEVIVAEFKLGWAQSHWESLSRDLQRLRGPVAQEIRQKFSDRRHRRPWVFLGTDCYRQNVAAMWKSGKSETRRIVPTVFGNAHRDYVSVWEETGPGFDGHYLTWALLPYDEMAA